MFKIQSVLIFSSVLSLGLLVNASAFADAPTVLKCEQFQHPGNILLNLEANTFSMFDTVMANITKVTATDGESSSIESVSGPISAYGSEATDEFKVELDNGNQLMIRFPKGENTGGDGQFTREDSFDVISNLVNCTRE